VVDYVIDGKRFTTHSGKFFPLEKPEESPMLWYSSKEEI
jgi:hypothetical protein